MLSIPPLPTSVMAPAKEDEFVQRLRPTACPSCFAYSSKDFLHFSFLATSTLTVWIKYSAAIKKYQLTSLSIHITVGIAEDQKNPSQKFYATQSLQTSSYSPWAEGCSGIRCPRLWGDNPLIP